MSDSSGRKTIFPQRTPDRRLEFVPAQEPRSGRMVRPYVITQGRTKASRHLAVETMISTRACPRWHDHGLGTRYHSVGAACRQPRSVAEVAVALRVPLGVARVLLGDMAEQGLVSVHGGHVTPSTRPDLALMRRVLDGLHRL